MRQKTISSKSHTTLKHKFKIKDAFRNSDELFNENIKLITNIESTGPKIECWVPKKLVQLNKVVMEKKREE